MQLIRHNVILSASYPEEGRDLRYLQTGEVSRRVAEAVIPLASILIANGATISFGGHPAITRLLAGIVSNFSNPTQRILEEPAVSEAIGETRFGRVILYQSAAFTAINEVDWLRSSPFVSVVDVPVDPTEVALGTNRAPKNYPRTLDNLREQLFHAKAPTAFVCIGGMDGVITEEKQFSAIYPDLPIFAYGTTGGASQIIAEQTKGQRIIIPDGSDGHRYNFEADSKDDGWKFTEGEMSELEPYSKAAFEVANILSRLK